MLAITGLVGALSWQALAATGHERAGREAARGLLADLRDLAHQARRERRSLAMEIDAGTRERYRVFADGNGNGVTGADILAGVDRDITGWRPVFREGRARLAIERALPEVDGDGTLEAGSNPVRLGVMTRIGFTTRGTGTAGTLYVAGSGGRAYAVRLLGTTQRVRLLCLADQASWEAC